MQGACSIPRRVSPLRPDSVLLCDQSPRWFSSWHRANRHPLELILLLIDKCAAALNMHAAVDALKQAKSAPARVRKVRMPSYTSPRIPKLHKSQSHCSGAPYVYEQCVELAGFGMLAPLPKCPSARTYTSLGWQGPQYRVDQTWAS